MDEVCNKLKPEYRVSVQSLISYEKGRVCPKIDVLMDLCRIYNVSADYILFAKSEFSPPAVYSDDILYSLYMLKLTGAATFDKDAVMTIKDEKLKEKLIKLFKIADHHSVLTLDSHKHLVEMINELVDTNTILVLKRD